MGRYLKSRGEPDNPMQPFLSEGVCRKKDTPIEPEPPEKEVNEPVADEPKEN